MCTQGTRKVEKFKFNFGNQVRPGYEEYMATIIKKIVSAGMKTVTEYDQPTYPIFTCITIMS